MSNSPTKENFNHWILFAEVEAGCSVTHPHVWRSLVEYLKKQRDNSDKIREGLQNLTGALDELSKTLKEMDV